MGEVVEQYESEITTLQMANNQTITSLEERLEQAIEDKEEIAEGYIGEIDKLELALTEAVNQLQELQNENETIRETLRKHGTAQSLRSSNKDQRRRYRSLEGEVL